MSTPLCIICLDNSYLNCCYGPNCTKYMCSPCNLFIKNNSCSIKNLPYTSHGGRYIGWTCNWNCIYMHTVKYINNINETIISLVRNKQQNILQTIQFPFTLNKYLPQDLTQIVTEYAEFPLQEN